MAVTSLGYLAGLLPTYNNNGRVLIPYSVRPRFACRTLKTQKYHFLSMGPQEHPEWRGATHPNTETPKVPFPAKMTKMPLVNLGLTEGQTRSKSTQNNIFHIFFIQTRASRRFLATLTKFDPKLTSGGPKFPNFWFGSQNKLKPMSLQILSIGVRTTEISWKPG